MFAHSIAAPPLLRRLSMKELYVSRTTIQHVLNQKEPLMLRANRVVPLTIVCCVLTSMFCARAASADTIFFDDFNDRNTQDGSPVTWVPELRPSRSIRWRRT